MSCNPPLVLICIAPQRRAEAAELAQRLNLPLVGDDQGHFHVWRLELGPRRLELHTPLSRHPVFADWDGAEVRRRIAAGRRQPLARAFGLHRGGAPSVHDATAGLGRDGAVLAGLGCGVSLIERTPVLHVLLQDALHNAGAQFPLRLLPCQDARDYWRSNPTERPDCVYLDPMYPDRGKAALAKKEAQVLHALAGEDADADALLAPALAQARDRVVVKRHPKAPWLAQREPSHCLAGARVRYDVYLVR